MFIFLLTFAFYPEISRWVSHLTRITFDGASRYHHNVVIFYNQNEFTMPSDNPIPKMLVNPQIITAKSTGGTLRWMVMQTPLDCNSYDYFQINGNSSKSILFNPLGVQSNKRHCMFFGSNSKHSFTIYKGKFTPGRVFAENPNIYNSREEVLGETLTIINWNNLYLYYDKNESNLPPIVAVKSFGKISDEPVYSDFWRTDVNVIEERWLPNEYKAEFGYNSIELNSNLFTYIVFPDGQKVYAIFVDTQNVFYENGQKLEEFLALNNNRYIGLKPIESVTLEFYVMDTKDECQTISAMVNAAGNQAFFHTPDISYRKNCLILAAKYEMDYTLYYSSDMEVNDPFYIRDINQKPIYIDIGNDRIYNISHSKFSLVCIHNQYYSGKFGVYSCKFSSSWVSTDGLTAGLFGIIARPSNVQVKNLFIASFGKHSLNISSTEDTIIDFPTKYGFDSTIIIFNKQYFINQNEVYNTRRPLIVRSSSGYHTLYFKLILVDKRCKNSYIINGNSQSYFVNLQQTDGLICMHFVSYSKIKGNVINPLDDNFTQYGDNYMNYRSNSIEQGVTLCINNPGQINSLVGVANIETMESNPEEFSSGIFNKQFEIITFPKSKMHESKEGFNEIEIQNDELVILLSKPEKYQNMILNFKSTSSLKEFYKNLLEQNLRNKKIVYIQTTAVNSKISYYFSKFNNDCYTFNMVSDKIGKQYFMMAEPNKKHCISMISTKEATMMFYTEDQVTKVYKIKEYKKQTFQYIEFSSNNETNIMIKEIPLIGNEFISNPNNIYSESKQLQEIGENYYIAHPGYNSVSLSKTKIIYPIENGFKVFVVFNTQPDVYLIKGNKRGIISELNETLGVETQESSINFFLLVLPDGDYSYDFCFKPKYSQVYWNTSVVEPNKKHVLVLFGGFDISEKQVIRTPAFPNDETFNVYESYIYGCNKTVITDTLKTFRTDCLIVEYISSSTMRSGIVGIYDIGYFSSNYQSFDTILSLDEAHKFDGFIDPVKVSTTSNSIYGPNSYRNSPFSTLAITYEQDDKYNHFLYFNDEKSLMKCDHSPILKLIHFDKTFVIKSVSDYYSDTIYHLKMDKNCDTVDLLFNQYGNRFTVDPLHYKPNKMYCIATLTSEESSITLKKYDYSDSTYSLLFSKSFNMEESFEISSTTYKQKFYSMIKIITSGDCYFPYCEVLFGQKDSSLQPKIYHIDGFNHLFEGKSLVRQLFVSQLGYNSFDLKNYEVTTIKFAKLDKFNTFVIFHSIQYINESSSKTISISITNPGFISVFSGEYNIEFTVFQLAKDCIVHYTINYFSELFFTNANTKENSKYCIIHLGTGEMTSVLFKDPKTSNLNSFSYYDSFSMGSNPVIIKDVFTTLNDKKSFIIEYKVGEGNPYGHVGISSTTQRYVSGKFDFPGKDKETESILNQNETNQSNDETETNDRISKPGIFFSSKFGRNTAKVSKNDVITVITPVSSGKNYKIRERNIRFTEHFQNNT